MGVKLAGLDGVDASESSASVCAGMRGTKDKAARAGKSRLRSIEVADAQNG